MSSAALINNTNTVINVIALEVGTEYNPPSGQYVIFLPEGSPVATGYTYDPDTELFSPPPVTMVDLQNYLLNNIGVYGGLVTCGDFIVDPSTVPFHLLFPKIFNEYTTDTRTIIDASGEYQTVTNQNIIDMYNINSDNYQKQLDVIKAVFDDIANSTITTTEEIDSSLSTYIAAVGARENTEALV